MTDTEKLANYERVPAIIRDALALEKHFAEEAMDLDTIELLRLDAYKHIVDETFERDALRQLEVQRSQSRLAKSP